MAHPYTRGLFGARPRLGDRAGSRLTTIEGTVPELVDLPAGCAFADRCAWAQDACHHHAAASDRAGRRPRGQLPAPGRRACGSARMSSGAPDTSRRANPPNGASPAPDVLLQVDQVTRTYTLPREKLWAKAPLVHALQGVSLSVTTGQSLGIVGESGSGKSTLARLVMALEPPSSRARSGFWAATWPHWTPPDKLRAARRDFQMVFQDPYGSLDPRQTVERIVTEPLQAQGETTPAQWRQQAGEVLASVGLRATDLDKYPHEFSGGQRQRIAIARALITRPRLIVADEPVSALDVSVQAQVLNLMQDLQQQFGVTYLLISHDLAVVDHLCAEVAVIFQGRIVEQGSPLTLFQNAAHPYTRALLDAVPRMEPRAHDEARRRTVSITPRPQLPLACPYAHRCRTSTGEARVVTRPATGQLVEHATRPHCACVAISAVRRRLVLLLRPVSPITVPPLLALRLKGN